MNTETVVTLLKNAGFTIQRKEDNGKVFALDVHRSVEFYSSDGEVQGKFILYTSTGFGVVAEKFDSLEDALKVSI